LHPICNRNTNNINKKQKDKTKWKKNLLKCIKILRY
jgi:hypothetical protein